MDLKETEIRILFIMWVAELTFVILKLTNVITWSWLWALPYPILLIVIATALGVASWNEKKSCK